MTHEIKPPLRWWTAGIDQQTIFLAGSIEMGKAEDWQSKVVRELRDLPLAILNPRRDDWDDTWFQSIEHAQFREQVEWELVGLEAASHVLVYFSPDTLAPITLLELGILTDRPGRVTVCCPDGFYRKGNVEIVCSWYSIPMVETLDDLIDVARRLSTPSA